MHHLNKVTILYPPSSFLTCILNKAIQICARVISKIEFLTQYFCSQALVNWSLLDYGPYDVHSVLLRRQWYIQMQSKSFWSKNGSVNDVRSVCGSNNKESFWVVHSIELSQKLVDHSLNDLVSICGSLRTHSINLIKENKTGSVLSCSLEKISDALLALAKVLVEKLRSFDIDKVCLTSIGYGLSKHCLSTTRRTI